MFKRLMAAGGTGLMISAICCTQAFAIEESEVESAIAASSNEAVAGNIFIWFLCAVAFLKISQKIDSFLAGLGINVGRTGGSMLGELLIAGRAIGAAAGGLGGAVGNIFNRNHATGTSTTHQAAGQAFTGGGNGLIGVAKRAAGNAAASSATGTGSGLGSVIGGAMFGSSMAAGGQFANSVVGAVATGNISTVGSIKGEKAAQALTNYLGYNGAATGGSGANDFIDNPAGGVAGTVIIGNEMDAAVEGEDVVTVNGGTAAGGRPNAGSPTGGIPGSPFPNGGPATTDEVHSTGAYGAETGGSSSIPTEPPTFRDVEIGGGRITGYETPAGGGDERQFAMYNAAQYMAPTGPYETVQTVDGESWYKQYAQPTVQRTPHEDSAGKITYDEKIVEQLPQIPKRKDRV
ncbi:MAG: hypothetical protein ACLRRI_01990 [Oscillospiraceae bacterium]